MASINVTYPNSSSVIKRGEYIIIKWELIDPSGITNDLKITIQNTALGESININVALDNTRRFYIYKIPENMTLASDWFVKIKEVSTAIADESDTFPIEAKYSISEFLRLNSWEKMILIEMKLGKEIDVSSWVSIGVNSYYLDYVSNEEIIDLKENDTYLSKVYSISICDSTDGSFYVDYVNEKLYINPSVVDAFYMAYIFKCFTNRQDQDYPIDFIPQNALYNIFYLPFLQTSSIPSISQKVGDYYTSALTIQFGSITFVNDGTFWEMKPLYEWHNKQITVKVGEKDSPYNQFVTIFDGITKNPDFSDEIVSVGVKDARAGYLKPIPVSILTVALNPELPSGYINKPTPLLFGIKNNITCIRIDDKEYLIGGTIFEPDGITEINYESIDAVYVDGIAQVLTFDYTVNVENTKITFVNDPIDGLVTADVHGLQCEVDFSDGSFTGNFSENTADILYTMLISQSLNNIPIGRIDLDSFEAFQTKRTQRIGFLLDTLKATMDIIRVFQSSTVFHFIPTLDGRFQVRYYDRITENLPEFRNENYKGFKILEQTDSAFKKVIIKYDRDPSLDEWKQVEISEMETGYKYDKEDVLTLETYLVNEAEAEALAEFMQGLVKDPAGKLSTEITAEGLEYIPSDKAKFSRSITKGDGTEVVILIDEIYLILEVRKDINTGKVGITAIKDTQATGEGSHADVEHADEHSDSHSDAHTDEAHTDTYSDISHTDDHFDISHTDTYEDISYLDYEDVAHTDHAYDDHTDLPFEPHDDTPHDDIPHEDHNDNPHADTHGDISHTDSYDDISHSDTHGDGHNDSYIDTHSDTHDDIPHTDSDI